jgi:predicted NBD/HSP70 family sugar kinase
VTRVSRPDDIRRHNLALLLGSVHRFGPLTRAELTVRLGLNRSTVGVLVAELCALGLLEESVPAAADREQRAGRPSHVVRPRADGPYGIAVDVDVDRFTTAALPVGGRLLAQRVVPLAATIQTAGAVARAIACEVAAVIELVEVLSPGAWPVGVGVSIPGTVRTAEGIVEAAPNLQWWNEPLAAMLTGLLPAGLPVSLANDADLGVLAEHLRGAATDAADVVYLNGKVGVGAGIIIDGRPLGGVGGLAGEIGHTVLDPAGPPCHCGGRGCVENYIGETAILHLAGRSGAPTAESTAAVMAAAESGEPAALQGVNRVADSLGSVLANLVNMLNPRVIVLGGALRDVFRVARDQVMAALDLQAMNAARRMVEIRISGLEGDSSLVGAGELALRPLLADPSSLAVGPGGAGPVVLAQP